MRNHYRCPKCDHGEVLYVPEPRDQDYDRMALGGMRSVWSGNVNAALEAYVCLKCGYTELYVQRPREINLDKIDDARVLKAEDGTGPYR